MISRLYFVCELHDHITFSFTPLSPGPSPKPVGIIMKHKSDQVPQCMTPQSTGLSLTLQYGTLGPSIYNKNANTVTFSTTIENIY